MTLYWISNCTPRDILVWPYWDRRRTNKLEMCNSYLAELHLKIRAIPICSLCFAKTAQNIAIWARLYEGVAQEEHICSLSNGLISKYINYKCKLAVETGHAGCLIQMWNILVFYIFLILSTAHEIYYSSAWDFYCVSLSQIGYVVSKIIKITLLLRFF